MANTKISEMTDATSVSGADEVPILQGGANKRATLTEVGALIAPAASTSAAGIVELATNAETITGTDTARAVTPASMKAALDDASSTLGDISLPVVGTDKVWMARGSTAALADIDDVATYLGTGVNLSTVAEELFGVLRPSVGSPTGTDNADDTADLSGSVPAAGTLYVAVTNSGTQPTSYDVLTANVTGAEYEGNGAAGGAGTVTITSTANAITNDVNRYAHFVFKRTSDGMVSPVATSAAFQVTEAGSFLPSDRGASLHRWYKLNTDITGASLPTVDAWGDQSANNNDMATGGGAPQKTASGCIRLDGTGDYIGNTNLAGSSTDYTIYARLRILATPNGLDTLIMGTSSLPRVEADGSVGLGFFDGTQTVSDSSAFALNTWFTLCIRASNTLPLLMKCGANAAVTGVASTAGIASDLRLQFTMGVGVVGGREPNMDIAEVVCINGGDDSTQIAQMFTYLDAINPA